MKYLTHFFSLGLFMSVSGCSPTGEKLPYIGEPETITKVVDGKEVTEREYPTIPPFSFTNQYGKTVTQNVSTAKFT